MLALMTLAAAPSSSDASDTDTPPRCEADEHIDVMALVYNDRHPSKSFAMIAVDRGNGRMVGVGSYIAGRPIIAVHPRALWLGPVEDPCWMPIAHDGKQRVTSPKKAKKRKAKKKKKRRKRRR